MIEIMNVFYVWRMMHARWLSMHGGKVEVIFTKLYNIEDQKITAEEETLMSIAMFMRQPGFAELLRNEFHNIAMDNISKLTDSEEINNE